MEDGTEGDALNPWALDLFDTVRGVEPRTAQEAAYDKWLEQTSTREEARRDRVHGAAGVIPSPLWIVLFFISCVVFVYMLFFADSGEGAVTQGMLMGAVASVITTMLLLLSFLDNPFHGRRWAPARRDGAVAARSRRGPPRRRPGHRPLRDEEGRAL